MSDKMREEFERSPKFRGMDFRRAPEAPEYYLSPYANGAWDGWQASREALVIELPQSLMPADVDHHSDLPLMYGGAVVATIEAAGLKVKP